jgi:hypothetical protein
MFLSRPHTQIGGVAEEPEPRVFTGDDIRGGIVGGIIQDDNFRVRVVLSRNRIQTVTDVPLSVAHNNLD